MDRGGKEFGSRNQAAGDLEQYRRLVELQKQMIELAQQNKLAEQQCAALRERVGSEVIARVHKRAGLRRLLRRKAEGVLKRLPKFQILPGGPNQKKFKEPSPC